MKIDNIIMIISSKVVNNNKNIKPIYLCLNKNTLNLMSKFRHLKSKTFILKTKLF